MVRLAAGSLTGRLALLLAGQLSQAGTQVGRRWQLRLADRGGLEDSDCQPGISGRPQPIFNLKLDQEHCPIQSTCPGTQAGQHCNLKTRIITVCDHLRWHDHQRIPRHLPGHCDGQVVGPSARQRIALTPSQLARDTPSLCQ